MTALEKAMQNAREEGIRFDYVQANGLRMHYARIGSGRPLVLLHGWPEFWIVFKPLMMLLKEDFELIVPDLRGCGFTGKPSPGPDKNAGAETHADDIADFTQQLGLENFGMVGGDLGAYVLQAFSLKYAERLRGAFYFCTPYPGLGSRYGQPDHLIEVWYQYFQQLPWAAELVGSSRENCKLYMSHFLNHWSGDNPAVFRDLLDIYSDMFMLNNNIQGGFDWYVSSAANRRKWLEGSLPKPPRITVPSRFLWGKRDPLIRPEWSDKLGEYFDNYTIDFADAGHFVHYEAPQICAREIRAFFGDSR
ncbi:alpha/beta fold hydrolase [Herbaspirillum chlorophenolicum]|uniref:alpha/beta fold hydrolase n=1 Tax=Herbaspirillum chlorophenolicum TaxID=211589 RepID=UPI00067AB188|nr:alpha/beta hydrolase [Herbaspirillum chlorophenolicum]